MPPSFTCIVKVKARSFQKQAVASLNNITKSPLLKGMFTNIPNSALNHVLFRCEHEERDVSGGKISPYGLKSTG